MRPYDLSRCPFCGTQLPLDLRPIPSPVQQCSRCGAPFPAITIDWPGKTIPGEVQF
jgi:hypothetical protein